MRNMINDLEALKTHDFSFIGVLRYVDYECWNGSSIRLMQVMIHEVQVMNYEATSSYILRKLFILQ